MVEVSQLTKFYRDFQAIKGVSFTAHRGETLGFLGPNGAGKTTTMRIITGFMPATTGSVKVDGFDTVSDPIEVRRRIGYLRENPPLYGDMRVTSYLRFVGRIKGVPKKHIETAVDEALEMCALTHVAFHLIRHLSRGYRQRVGLAQALVHDPPVLILDEPTIGLDPKQIIEIRGLIKTLSQKRTVILSAHILPEVSQVCDKVVIINAGRVVVEEKLSELTQGGSLEEVFLRYISEEEADAGATEAGETRFS